MFRQLAVEYGQEDLVSDFAHTHAGLVEHREDSFALLFHQIYDDAIVEVVNVFPGDAFFLVLLLFLLQNQLDEDLLQFLVAVVDAELFERVDVEDLEAVDVEHADQRPRHRLAAASAAPTDADAAPLLLLPLRKKRKRKIQLLVMFSFGFL